MDKGRLCVLWLDNLDRTLRRVATEVFNTDVHVQVYPLDDQIWINVGIYGDLEQSSHEQCLTYDAVHSLAEDHPMSTERLTYEICSAVLSNKLAAVIPKGLSGRKQAAAFTAIIGE